VAPPRVRELPHRVNLFPAESVGDVQHPEVVEHGRRVVLDAAATKQVGLLVGARQRVAAARGGLARRLGVLLRSMPQHLAGLGLILDHGCLLSEASAADTSLGLLERRALPSPQSAL
jgi:hypothetical protein